MLAGLVVDHEVIGGRHFHSGRVHVDEKGGNAAAASLFSVRDCEHLGEIRIVGPGDEALDAVDDVVSAVAHRRGAHRRRVGAGVRFGLGEAAPSFSADHRHEILFPRLALELVEDRADGRSEDVDVARGQRRAARDFAPDNDLGHHAEPEAAEFLRHVVQPEPERLRLAAQPLRQLLLHLDVVDDFALERDQLAVDETADVFLQQAKLFGKLEIHCSGFSAQPAPRCSGMNVARDQRAGDLVRNLCRRRRVAMPPANS
jgi:hypothetical protein